MTRSPMRARRRARAASVALAAIVFAAAITADPPSTPAFDASRAFEHVRQLVAIGPRPPGSPGSRQTRHYIATELDKSGLKATEQAFTASTPFGPVPMANVSVVIPGASSQRILFGGHYDTKLFRQFRFVGANDGGSSAGVLIELTRRLAATAPREYTYWVVWFDGEEARVSWTATDSLYGSRRLAADLRRDGRLPRAMVLLDMIGDRDLTVRRDANSTPWLVDIVWAAAARLGHSGTFSNELTTIEDDHLPFLRAGVPAVDIIDLDYPAWHTAADTLDTVSARSLQIVGDVVLAALPDIEKRLLKTGN